MKDYEEKVLNIMESVKDNIKTQLDKAYKSGYEDAKSELGQNAIDLAHEESDRAYQQGLEDAWEVVRKLFVVPTDALMELFDTKNPFLDYSAQEAIAKIREYEAKKKQDTKIKVGDEVVLNGNASYENEKAVILAYDGKSYPYNVLMDNGDSEWVKEDAIERKTGRHFPQIAEVLEKMRGESEWIKNGR